MSDKGTSKITRAVSLDRVRSVVAKSPPTDYVEVNSLGKRASRHAVYKDATAVLPLGEKLPVIIRNITPRGCRIEFFQNRALEGRLLLTEPSLPLRSWALVAWSDKGACGLTFIASPSD